MAFKPVFIVAVLVPKVYFNVWVKAEEFLLRVKLAVPFIVAELGQVMVDALGTVKVTLTVFVPILVLPLYVIQVIVQEALFALLQREARSGTGQS